MDSNIFSYGIHIERKTLYSDIALLQDYGVDVIKSSQGKHVYYHIGSREFELAELKLLVDLIQSSKFLTEKKYQNNHSHHFPIDRIVSRG